MKTLRALPVVLIGAVILGCVSCRNYDFSESLEDDFEITGTSTEESIGTFTSSNDVLEITTETTDDKEKNISVVSGVTVADQDAQGSNADNQGRHERDNSANADNESEVSVPTSTSVPQSEEPIATSTTVSVSSTTTSTETPKPTATPVPTATSTPVPTNTPVPTATPTPEPTETLEPTPKPAVAAKIRVTLRVWGSDDPDGEDNDVSVIVYRTYTVQPKDGCTYHSYNTGSYVAPDMQIDTSDINSDFYAQYPNGLAVGYAYIGGEIIGFVDD